MTELKHKLNTLNVEVYECDYRFLVDQSKNKDISFSEILNLYTQKVIKQDEIIATTVDILIEAQNIE